MKGEGLFTKSESTCDLLRGRLQISLHGELPLPRPWSGSNPHLPDLFWQAGGWPSTDSHSCLCLRIQPIQFPHYLIDFGLFLGFRILLGITDSGVDTVWRTPEGFVAPWANWNPGTNEPNGVTGDPEDIQDCVRRATSNGKWIDDHCTPAKQYPTTAKVLPSYCQIDVLSVMCWTLSVWI